jgi:hypothetical protein
MPSEPRTRASTPLARKLGIREGSRVLVSAAPDGFDLGPAPPTVVLLRRPAAPVDVALLFVTTASELRRRFATAKRVLALDGRLWVAWPKKASGVATDLDFDTVQRTGLEAGLVDNKSASITDDFQGLQFVVRLRDRQP